MFSITITRRFRARHAIVMPSGRLEPVNGHNWSVAVTVGAARLNHWSAVMDFHRLQRALEGVVGPWRGKMLNDVPPFADARGRLRLNPTAERVAQHIARALRPALPRGVRLVAVAVTEAPGCVAVFEP